MNIGRVAGSLCVFLCVSLMLSVSSAAVLEYSFNESGMDWMPFGFGKLETYDVAVRLSDPALEGASVTGVRIPVDVNDGSLSDISVWVSSELRLENKVNSPCIMSQAAGIDDNGFIDVDFGSPCVIPPGGIYVGYSFSVASLDEQSKMPLAVVYGDNPDGLYIHTSRSRRKWEAVGTSLDPKAVSAMTVRLNGDFHECSLGLGAPERSYFNVGEKNDLAVTLVNHGSVSVESFGYEYNVGNVGGGGTIVLPSPLERRFGASCRVMVPVDPLSEVGSYNVDFRITEVNGVPNPDPAARMDIPVVVMPFVPVKKPLVEEYTGTWCAYCPRGYVALEEMNELHGDDFVAIAIHDSDDMSVLTSYPNSISGLPTAVIDRVEEIDPSFISRRWELYRGQATPANIDVRICWADDDAEVLEAEATVRFLGDERDADYRIAYALVADGLSDDSWLQANAYAGSTEYSGKWWDIFTTAKGYVKGLVYNDVLVACHDLRGIESSLPGDIVGDTPICHSYSFRLADVLNVSGKPVIQDNNKLRVIAMLIDGKSGRVVNCNSSGYPDNTGVGAVTDSGEVVEMRFYDVNGLEISNPTKGIYTCMEILHDGRFRVRKVIM